MSLEYAVRIERLAESEGGGYLATVPDLPGCMSDGETPEQALRNVQDAIASWIEAAKEWKQEIPKPSGILGHVQSGVIRMPKKHELYVERRPEGDYAVRRGGSERASATAPTQQKAIQKAEKLDPKAAILVERVRDTKVGGR